MIVSLKFIEKFITLPKINEVLAVNNREVIIQKYDLKNICSILTCQGFEVDSIKYHGENLNTVVLGQVENIQTHPNANKLKICKVHIGDNNYLQIVCGAPNVREKLFVAVAKIGSTLPNNINIQPTKIRDVDSFGMLCSREELNLPTQKEFDGDGIWELNNEAHGGLNENELISKLGMPIFHVLNIDDVILDISVTPNRPDVLCHLGVAREIAAGFNYAKIPFEFKDHNFKGNIVNEQKVKQDAINNSSLSINDIKIYCNNEINIPTFFMLIDSIKVTYSPSWLRNLLETLGQTSINQIVDVSNYILLAYGQPNHAFDFQSIPTSKEKNKVLKIRNANLNETFIGLDGKTRSLFDTDTIVSSENETLSLLGVLGGESSKVTNDTKCLVVEFANPNSVQIRRTSRKHGRQTDASFLFEKGIDISQRYFACAEFFNLLNSISNNNLQYSGSFHSINNENSSVIDTEFKTQSILLKKSDQKNILGSEIISFENQLNILKSLGFKLTKKDDENSLVEIPSWRINDVVNSADLIEECIRVVGIDHVPAIPMISSNELIPHDVHFQFIEKLNSFCANLGYNEAISLHFMRSDDYKKCFLENINSLGEPIALLNPIIGDEPLLHTTLIPDLLRKVSKNNHYSIHAGQLFHSCRTFQNKNLNGQRVFLENGSDQELGKKLAFINLVNEKEYSFKYGYSYSSDSQKNMRPVETPRIAGVAFGVKQEKSWQNNAPIQWTLHDIMSHVLELGKLFNLKLEFRKMSDNTSENLHPMSCALHPGRQVEFYLNLNNMQFPIGWCGEFHPKVLREYEINTTCFGFELNVANLLHAHLNSNTSIQKIAYNQKFPSVSRDFSFVVNDNVTALELNNIIKNHLLEKLSNKLQIQIDDIYIFDIYKGKGVEDGKKSIAFKINIIPLAKTLTDAEIQSICAEVVVSMEINFKSQLRA